MQKSTLHNIFIWLAAAVLLGLFAVTARAVQINSIGAFDMPIIHTVQGAETDLLTTIMKTFTIIGSTKTAVVLVILFLAILAAKKLYKQAIFAAIVIGGTAVLNQGLKFIFQRPRPEFHRMVDVGGYSFPSGHTMMAFSIYTVIAYLIWYHVKSSAVRTLITLFAVVMIFMIAVSRIYLGVHFPSDIAGGVLLSAAWFIAAAAVYIRRFKGING